MLACDAGQLWRADADGFAAAIVRDARRRNAGDARPKLRRRRTEENLDCARRTLSRRLSAKVARISRRARGFHRDQIARSTHRTRPRLSKIPTYTLLPSALCTPIEPSIHLTTQR